MSNSWPRNALGARALTYNRTRDRCDYDACFPRYSLAADDDLSCACERVCFGSAPRPLRTRESEGLRLRRGCRPCRPAAHGAGLRGCGSGAGSHRYHLAAGRALAALRESGVLIIGSGSSSHNLGLMGRPEARQPLAAFEAWLQRTLVGATSEDRDAALSLWEAAPGARQAHPREEHLLPLMVAAGAARHEPGVCVYHEDLFFNTGDLSNYMFGESSRRSD